MRGALSVRIDDGYNDRIVTAKTRDLRFRKTAPGGHHSASCRLILPRDAFRDLGPADRLYVYDSRTARTIWEGYTENPGVTDGSGGQEFDLTAMGGMVLASDETRQLVYVDYSFDGWERAEDIPSAASASTEVSTRPSDGTPALLCQLNPGQPVTTGSRARMAYRAIEYAGMEIGGFTVAITGGAVDANYAMEITVLDGSTGLLSPVSTSMTTVASGYNKFAATDFPTGGNRLVVQLRRSAGGATNVATDTIWTAFTSLRVAGARVDKYGSRVTLTSATGVYASEVAADLLGRMLINVCDPATSTVEATSYLITNLAYKDGATVQRVLEEMSLYEPDFLWEILETGSSGKHRFNYRAWPTTPRYEISTRDGFNAPGGEVDLCNRIAVNYTDYKGKPQTEVVTQTVTELGSRVRDAEPINLPGVSTSTDANRIGVQVLAAKNNPPKAATAVVKRPILDRLTGMTVMPWEIEPGYLVRVRETGDDLRLTEMQYVDQDCAATLTLGTPVRSLEQMVADLSRNVAR